MLLYKANCRFRVERRALSLGHVIKKKSQGFQGFLSGQKSEEDEEQDDNWTKKKTGETRGVGG